MFRVSKRRLLGLLLAVTITLSVTVGAAFAEDEATAMFDRVRAVYNVVQGWHKDGADLETFIDGAIAGGLEALGDPHTNYFPPTEYRDFLDSLNGSFSGIGAYLDLEGSYVIISAPIKGTPAAKAGLQSGDRILEVDGTTLVGAPTEKAVRLIRGLAGSSVTLKVERPSEQRTFSVTITRAVISIPEVESKMLDTSLGYIQVASFGDDVVNDFYKAVTTLKSQGAKAIVLDLRQNPGGYLDAAVDLASAFVPAGEPVVWEVGRNGKQARVSSGRLINLPVAVLVDKGSASASEILAGAIQDYSAGPLIGTQTFGKGTVQQILNMSGGGGIKVTIAEYLTPKERTVHGKGLTPDVAVEASKPDSERTSPLETKRFLSMTSVGLDVLYLQYRLSDLGYKPDNDGFFGSKTQQAVSKFAQENGLEDSGMVDKAFVEVLNAKVAAQVRKRPVEDVQLLKAQEHLKKVLSEQKP